MLVYNLNNIMIFLMQQTDEKQKFCCPVDNCSYNAKSINSFSTFAAIRQVSTGTNHPRKQKKLLRTSYVLKRKKEK